MHTTKRPVYVHPNGAISYSLLNMKLFHQLTTTGGAISLQDVDWEITKQMRGQEALPIADWQARLAVATRWASALAFGGLTEQQALELIRDRDGPSDRVRTEIVEVSAIVAQDRYFRKGWECPVASTQIVCNMVKARQIHMDNIRLVRDRELVKLDVLWLQAQETANLIEQQRIVTEKQRLRDIPQTFDLSGYVSPATLKAAWPTALPR